MKLIKTISMLVLIGLTVSVGVASAEPIPLLDTKQLDGSRKDLDSYVGKGKWTLVMFWATDCIICKRQKPEISKFHDKHKSTDAHVVGVAIDGFERKQEIVDYIEEHSPSFPTLIAELPILAMNYQIATNEPFRGTPTYWLFSPKGELVGNNPGPLRVEAIERFISSHSS